MAGHDIIVVGAGMVGSAIGWGLARLGCRVLMLDGADESERAARANFGLVWGQSKGDTLPEYARWTREAIQLWPEFQAELFEEAGISCGFIGNGGLHICLSDAELEDRRALFARMGQIEGGNALDLRILDRHEVADLIPGIGPDVVGAGFCGQDGHVSPHGLLMAMHRAFVRRGGDVLSSCPVLGIEHNGTTWTVQTKDGLFRSPTLVLAAGTGNKVLGARLGVDIPVFGLKGQILVSERVSPRLNFPTHKVRQTEVGTILLGDSKEPDAGSDDRATVDVMRDIAGRCLRMLPWLAEINLVRAWGGIRSMTADSYPIYDVYPDHPGLFSASCHSGVTLAPIHAMRLAPLIAAANLTPQLAAMSARRFDVQTN
ncbi:NAD(P)/FAD-dependent oxidoreductase [Agrobacterium arsenijevicii]|uniref:FAD dependent oxidoreductase domain-containing protein n=1 Tax=Agrobacterium arsenijevicii TaxID=1585697 RepID=A0ABR5CZA2_9HYPH|nr:hypothetical protein RP75_27950 [Agrobacterium arsenijevicii]